MLIATVYVLTGLVWTGRSLLEVLAQPDYWDAVTTLDWLAVWSYSLAFALLALAISLLARDSRAGRFVDVTAVAVSLAAALAAVGNVIEDVFGVGGASTFYVIGALGTLAGLIVLAAALWIGGEAVVGIGCRSHRGWHANNGRGDGLAGPGRLRPGGANPSLCAAADGHRPRLS